MYRRGKSDSQHNFRLDITYFEDIQITLLLGEIHKGKHQSDFFSLKYFKM